MSIKKRTTYAPAFKENALRLYLEGGRSYLQICEGFASLGAAIRSIRPYCGYRRKAVALRRVGCMREAKARYGKTKIF